MWPAKVPKPLQGPARLPGLLWHLAVLTHGTVLCRVGLAWCLPHAGYYLATSAHLTSVVSVSGYICRT